MTEYTKEFEVAWKLYSSPKNASKAMAFRNWQRLGKSRPPQELILAEISCYNNWLYEQTAKTGREYPKCHFATWLAQQRYEGFEDEARATLAQAVTDGHSLADQSASAQSWANRRSALEMAGVSPGEIAHWFLPTTLISSADRMEIRAPSRFHAMELGKRFGVVIRKVLGPETRLVVAKKIGADP